MSRRKKRDLFDLRIEQGPRSTGARIHRAPGIKCTMTKKIAMKDISEECGENMTFRMNYLHCESLVLFMCRFDGLEL